MVPLGLQNLSLIGRLLYNSKNDPEMAGPKVSIIKRFHCRWCNFGRPSNQDLVVEEEEASCMIMN